MLKSFFIFLLIILTGVQCRKSPDPVAETRSFYMGVTPWPADFTQAEVDSAYLFINQHCDIVSHHFDEGIPYDEAYNNIPMPLRLQQEVQGRKTQTAAGKKIMLSVAPLALSRKEKAPYYRDADATTDSIKAYWNSLSFSDPKIVTAYVAYVSYLVQVLQPDFINFGVESNVNTWDATAFAEYKDFLAQVYQRLKSSYPLLPLFISFIVNEEASSLAYAAQLIPYTDYVGLSAYPYTSVSSSADGNTDPAKFPANYFTRYTDLAPNKPLAFAETGYIAQNLVIPSFNLNKQGSDAWQETYLQKVCAFCNEKKAKLLIWFCHKDYDAGIATLQSAGLYQDLFSLWKDTGLQDENGRQRPAYNLWLQWMNKQKVE